MIEAILTDDTLQLVALVTLVAALADLAAAVAAALRRHELDPARLADFLGSHILARAIPIVALAVTASALSHGAASMVDVPPALSALTATAWTAALAGVVAYATSTLASLRATVEGVH